MGEKALFIRFSSLGDVIISNYSAMMTKQIHPDWSITWLVDSLYAPIVRSQPWVDFVIEWDRAKSGNLGFLKILRDVRRAKFNVVVDMHSTDRSNFFVCLSGIPVKYGNMNLNIPFKIYARDIDTDLLKGKGDISRCRSYLAAGEPTGKVAALLEGGDSSRGLIIMAIGASYPKKRWPVSSWIQFSRLAISKGYRLAMVGDGKDEERAAYEIEKALRTSSIINAVGKLSLSELVEAVSRGDIVLSGDTGPMHIGRALGLPVVAMFGPSLVNKDYMAGFYKTLFSSCGELGCARWTCGKPCLETIEPDKVFSYVEKYFNEAEALRYGR